MNTELMGIIRTQRIAEQVAIKREHRDQNNAKESDIKRELFAVDEKKEDKTTNGVAKGLKREQVKDIMQCMQAQSISRMIKINQIAG